METKLTIKYEFISYTEEAKNKNKMSSFPYVST